MNRPISVILFLVFILGGCNHFTPISTSEVYTDQYTNVSKVVLFDNTTIKIENSDSNEIIIADSILIINNNSDLLEINNKEVKQYYQSEFSIARTIALTTGIAGGISFLVLHFMSHLTQ